MSELELWNELGNIYYSTGEYNKAIHTCHKVIELAPGSGVPYSNLASIFICQGRFTEAIPMFHKAIELLGEAINKAPLWKQLGDAYRKLEDYENASASYQKAIDLEPRDEAARKNLAEVELASRNMNTESSAATGQDGSPSFLPGGTGGNSAEMEGTGTTAPGSASWVFGENRPSEQVDKAASDVSEISPVILGNRMLEETVAEENIPEQPGSADGDKASEQSLAEQVEMASSPEIGGLHPGNSGNSPLDSKPPVESLDLAGHAVLRLGILDWRRGEFERALQFLRSALDEAEKSQDLFLKALCHYVTAQVQTDLGKIEDAIQSYQSAANLAPERIFPWNNMGNLNCMLGHYEDARAAFQEAIEHDPKDPVSWNGLGDVYHKLGRFEDAIAAYQLGNVFERQGLEEDVLKELEKTLDFDQGNPQVWNEAGDIYYQIGAFQDAIESYRKAIELEPANATFQAGLAKAEQALEETNVGKEAPSQLASAEILQETLLQPESRLQETALPQAELGETPQMDLARQEPAQSTATTREQSSRTPGRIADLEPDSAYWMFKPTSIQRKNQLPAPPYLPAGTELMISTPRPDPAFTLRTHPGQSFSGNQALQDGTEDHASFLIQLPPRANPKDKPEESTNPLLAKQYQESAPAAAGVRSFNPPSSTMSSRRADSASTKPDTGNQAADRSTADLENQKNEIAACRRVTELNPMNDRAWDALGNMYEANGLHNEAIAAFEQAIALDPQKEAYHYHLGIALAYQNQYEKAIQVLQRVVDTNPQFMLAHCALAGYYRRLGQEIEAQEHIKIARPSIENENEYNQACFESISGDADRAIALLEIALERQQVQPAMVLTDPDLDFIRKDPRFVTLLYKNKIIG